MTRALFTRLLVAGALLSGACTMKDQEAPALTGPSELGTSIVVTASPDILPQDGGSQSLITITARDANSAPIRNLSLRVGMRYGAATVDFGSLSARTLVTDGDGRATLTYTAPPSAATAPDTNAVVTIVVTPIGSDYLNSMERIAVIRLVPPGVVIPGDGLVARFTFTPTQPAEDENILFDASTSASNPLSPITTYSWNFGDGATATGRTAQHAYTDPGTYAVTLTVGDAYGRSNTTVQSISIATGTNPNAAFTFSPSSPVPGQAVHFNAASSTAAAGRTIVRYDWNYGDGKPDESGAQVSHVFDAAGTYSVTLTVTDSAGRTDTQTTTVDVGADAPTADFTFSPMDATAPATITFNASSSRAIGGRTIVSYSWDFGDPANRTAGTGAQPAHTYTAAGTYNVTLTVTDSAGRPATTTKSVTVK